MRPALVLREFESLSAPLRADEAEILRDTFGPYLEVQPGWQPGRYRLAAKHYVGTIQIDDLRIRIEPKTPAPNLFYMLTYAFGLPELRAELTELVSADDLFEFVVSVFVRQVEELARKGIHRAYQPIEESLPYLRGRLALAPQLRRAVSAPGRFEQTLHEFTADILENRILTWTLHKLGRYSYRGPLLMQRLRRVAHGFADVSLSPVRDDEFERVVFTRLNDSYRTPLRIARLLLQLLSIEGESGSHPFNAWLLDMNRLFELFIANYLAEYIAGDRALRRLDVAIQQSYRLSAQPGETANPDIVLKRDGRPVLVLDTKHKVLAGSSKPEDRRQILEYCNVLRLTHGVLVFSGGSTSHPVSTYPGTLTLMLRNLVWPLDGSLREFRERCDALACRVVREMILEPSNSGE